MANIAGSIRGGVVDKDRYSTTTSSWPIPGSVRVMAVQLGSNPAVWKNKGYYAAGSVWESWITVGDPSTFNSATGHGPSQLSEIQHQQVLA